MFGWQLNAPSRGSRECGDDDEERTVIRFPALSATVGLLCLLGVGWAGGRAAAQETVAMPSPTIGIVDVDKIIQDSAAAKDVRTQADKFRQSLQQESTTEENALRATQQQIEQQRKTLSQDVLAEKARAFDSSVAEFQRKELARRRAFEKSFNTAMGQVQQAMLEAAQKVAAAHGANVVLPRAQVMLFDEKMNMTKEIIAAMDKALPHVEFPPPKVETDGAAPAPAPAAAEPKKKN